MYVLLFNYTLVIFVNIFNWRQFLYPLQGVKYMFSLPAKRATDIIV